MTTVESADDQSAEDPTSDDQPVAGPPGGAPPGDDHPGDGPPGGGRSPRRARPVFLVVGVVLAVGLAVGLFTGIGTGSGGGRPVAGAQVPTFSLPRVGGNGTVGVPADGGGGGKPAILLFFASWCGPCQAEVPAVASTYRRQQATGSPLAKVALIGVDASDNNGLKFVRRSGVTFPVGSDREYTVTEGKFAFTGLPEAVFVNRDGAIAAIHEGAITTAQLVAWEHRLLYG